MKSAHDWEATATVHAQSVRPMSPNAARSLILVMTGRYTPRANQKIPPKDVPTVVKYPLRPSAEQRYCLCRAYCSAARYSASPVPVRAGGRLSLQPTRRKPRELEVGRLVGGSGRGRYRHLFSRRSQLHTLRAFDRTRESHTWNTCLLVSSIPHGKS